MQNPNRRWIIMALVVLGLALVGVAIGVNSCSDSSPDPEPTPVPTSTPTAKPTVAPTSTPVPSPTLTPTAAPSPEPTPTEARIIAPEAVFTKESFVVEFYPVVMGNEPYSLWIDQTRLGTLGYDRAKNARTITVKGLNKEGQRTLQVRLEDEVLLSKPIIVYPK
jgi:hypothetical protein